MPDVHGRRLPFNGFFSGFPISRVIGKFTEFLCDLFETGTGSFFASFFKLASTSGSGMTLNVIA